MTRHPSLIVAGGVLFPIFQQYPVWDDPVKASYYMGGRGREIHTAIKLVRCDLYDPYNIPGGLISHPTTCIIHVMLQWGGVIL